MCVYENIFNNESNDMKGINNYLIFLIRRMVKHVLKKSIVSNILKRTEYNYEQLSNLFEEKKQYTSH